MKRYLVAAVLFSGVLAANAAAADSFARDYLKPAVVKLETHFPLSELDPYATSDRCASAGSGFIVGMRHVVSAKHVWDVEEACGPAVILASSYYSDRQWLLKEVWSKLDVALLESESDIVDLSIRGRRPCTVPVAPTVYDTSALRYGVPGPLREPIVLPGEIQGRDNTFAPNGTLTFSNFDHGESGGPVVHSYRVVGMIKENVAPVQSLGVFAPSDLFLEELDNHAVERTFESHCDLNRWISGAVDVNVAVRSFEAGSVLRVSVALDAELARSINIGDLAREVGIRDLDPSIADLEYEDFSISGSREVQGEGFTVRLDTMWAEELVPGAYPQSLEEVSSFEDSFREVVLGAVNDIRTRAGIEMPTPIE